MKQVLHISDPPFHTENLAAPPAPLRGLSSGQRGEGGGWGWEESDFGILLF